MTMGGRDVWHTGWARSCGNSSASRSESVALPCRAANNKSQFKTASRNLRQRASRSERVALPCRAANNKSQFKTAGRDLRQRAGRSESVALPCRAALTIFTLGKARWANLGSRPGSWSPCPEASRAASQFLVFRSSLRHQQKC